MKIFINELKKILRPLPLLVLALFSLVYIVVIIYPVSLEPLTNLSIRSDNLSLTIDMIDLCGKTWEPEEVGPAAKELSDRYIRETESIIRANPLFSKAGVTDFESYRALESKNDYSRVNPAEAKNYDFPSDYPPYDPNQDYTLTPAEEEMINQSFFWDISPAIKHYFLNNNVINDYQSIPITQKNYYNKDSDEYEGIPDSGRERIREIYEGGEIRTILSRWGDEYVKGIYPLLAIMIIISLCILLAPLVTRDHMNHMTSLQYSSKTGRKTMRIQLWAMLFAAFLVSVIEITVVFGLLIKSGWSHFLDSGLNGFSKWTYNWFPGNYRQFLIVIAVLMITVSLATAMLTFLFSKICKNYISLLLYMIPMSALLAFVCYRTFQHPFAITGDYMRSLYQIIPIPYIEAYICGALLLIGVFVSAVVLKVQKREEIG